jgi:hypothetical protein
MYLPRTNPYLDVLDQRVSRDIIGDSAEFGESGFCLKIVRGYGECEIRVVRVKNRRATEKGAWCLFLMLLEWGEVLDVWCGVEASQSHGD